MKLEGFKDDEEALGFVNEINKLLEAVADVGLRYGPANSHLSVRRHSFDAEHVAHVTRRHNKQKLAEIPALMRSRFTESVEVRTNPFLSIRLVQDVSF